MEIHDEGGFRLIKVGPLGPFDNNAYVIVDPAAGEAAIVDMPAEGEKSWRRRPACGSVKSS